MEAEVSPINTPHPDDPGAEDEAELFFGGGDEEQPPEHPEELPQPQPEGVQDDGTPIEEPEPAADPGSPAESAGPTEEPAPDPQSAAGSEAAAAPEPESGPETPADEPQAEATADEPGSKKGGSLERGYIVFHKLPLTKRALEFLLEEIDSGNAPEPRVAYFKLHETQARRVEAAMADAYGRFNQQLGAKCDLAGVSSRAFQERHVEPKQVVETNLAIT